MRNLKKVLSLALALVMLLGMMVIGAGAATNYTDADQISNLQAAEVADALGIIEGSGGQFMPATELDRAQAAQIIARMMLGPDVAKTLTATGNKFVDAQGHWAAAAINYCANNGIVEGDGAVHFYPTNKVTGFQFAKMLLVALGYDAAIEGYNGSGWRTNVAIDALRAGLTQGVQVSDAVLTRDAAVQMVLNTLTADVMEYQLKGDGYGLIRTMTNTKTNYRTDNSNVTGGTSTPPGTDNGVGTMQFCELHFPQLKLIEGDEATYGNIVASWKIVKGNTTETISSTPVAYAQQYTALTTAGKIYSDLGMTGTHPADLYVDGVKSTITLSSPYSPVEIGGNGAVTTVWTDGNGDAKRITVVNTYVGDVAGVQANGAVTISPRLGGEAVGNVYGVTGLAVGDVVLYTKDNGIMVTAEKTTPVTGTLTAFTDRTESGVNPGIDRIVSVNGSATLGTETAQYSEKVAAKALATALNQTVTAVKDKYGYIIHVSGYTAPQSYAYVVKHATDYFGRFMAVVVDQNGQMQTWQVTNTPDQGGTGNSKLDGNLVSYTRAAGGLYTLADQVAAAADATVTNGTQMTVKGSRTVHAKGVATEPAINTTVFIVKRGENNYVAYQGIANVPSMTSSLAYNVSGPVGVQTAGIVKDGVVRAMYVDASASVSFSGTAADVIYLKTLNRVDGDATNGYYGVYTAIVNGVIDYEFKATPINAPLHTLYTFSTYNAKTGVTAIDVTALGSTTVGTVSATYGAVNLGAAGGGFSYDNNTRVYWVDKNKINIYNYSIENVPTKSTDKVWYADRGGLLTLLVIEEAAAGSDSDQTQGAKLMLDSTLAGAGYKYFTDKDLTTPLAVKTDAVNGSYVEIPAGAITLYVNNSGYTTGKHFLYKGVANAVCDPTAGNSIAIAVSNLKVSGSNKALAASEIVEVIKMSLGTDKEVESGGVTFTLTGFTVTGDGAVVNNVAYFKSTDTVKVNVKANGTASTENKTATVTIASGGTAATVTAGTQTATGGTANGIKSASGAVFTTASTGPVTNATYEVALTVTGAVGDQTVTLVAG